MSHAPMMGQTKGQWINLKPLALGLLLMPAAAFAAGGTWTEVSPTINPYSAVGAGPTRTFTTTLSSGTLVTDPLLLDARGCSTWTHQVTSGVTSATAPTSVTLVGSVVSATANFASIVSGTVAVTSATANGFYGSVPGELRVAWIKAAYATASSETTRIIMSNVGNCQR